jgi:hypothetical protein
MPPGVSFKQERIWPAQTVLPASDPRAECIIEIPYPESKNEQEAPSPEDG